MPKRKSSRHDGNLAENSAAPRPPLRRWAGYGGIVLLVLVFGGLVFADWWNCLPEGTSSTYVGGQRCIECHATQHSLWTGSHHDLAMDRATDETVLGDFNNVELTHYGVTSRMHRDGDKFLVNTEGPDGKMADFEVKYVFGVDPLQQYMVEFDRPADMPENEIARVQVLRLSWDTNKKAWFYLSPPDVDEKLEPDDDLHWTGIAQRWNNMCADCHSTNLQKNYDIKTRTYHTTFSEIDVSCEECHGPGSTHIELAGARSLFWDRKLGYGLAKLKSTNADIQIHMCAKCHSRRRIAHPDFRPGENYYDYFANELLQEQTYHADGQILDEVYVFGSFIQSKMYDKGVRCTDCHDPHTAMLIHQGNQVCTSCHQHPAGKYDAISHHRHNPGSKGAQCVECHMPETTYMAVDPRRDHGFRVPRPGLSVKLGTPNACTGCHLKPESVSEQKRGQLKEYADWLRLARGGDEEIQAEIDRVNAWAHRFAVDWWGDKSGEEKAHFAHQLTAARNRDPKAEDALALLALDNKQPAIVRATALLEASQFLPSMKVAAASRAALKDRDPQVRAAAAANMQGLPQDVLVEALVPLLEDESRVVRTEAGRVLAGVSWRELSGPQRRLLQAAVDEYIAGLNVSNDRAGGRLSLGVLYENMGKADEARRAYESAILVEPNATGPRANLAALLDRQAEQIDRSAREAAQRRDVRSVEAAIDLLQELHERSAELRKQELEYHERDASLAPDNAFVQYRYGLSLYLHDKSEEAETALLQANKLRPDTAEFVLALALLYQKLERYQKALPYAEQVVKLRDNPGNQRLLQQIRAQAAGR